MYPLQGIDVMFSVVSLQWEEIIHTLKGLHNVAQGQSPWAVVGMWKFMFRKKKLIKHGYIFS